MQGWHFQLHGMLIWSYLIFVFSKLPHAQGKDRQVLEITLLVANIEQLEKLLNTNQNGPES